MSAEHRPPGQSPELKIVTQPAKFHRFRYESEIDFGKQRLGGCLHGGSGEGSHVTVRIDNIPSECVSKLRLRVCTVGEDRAPHPFYLHGDSCSDGQYKWEKDIGMLGGSDCVGIEFSRLTIVCTKRTRKSINLAMQQRKLKVAPFHDQREQPLIPYTPRNVDTVRLAFSLSFVATEDGKESSLPTVFSECVTDSRKNLALTVEEINPTVFSTVGGERFGIYCKNATTGINKQDVKIAIALDDEGKEFAEATILELKKHLLVATMPPVQPLLSNQRIKAACIVTYRGSHSNKLSIVFDGRTAGGADSASAAIKRQQLLQSGVKRSHSGHEATGGRKCIAQQGID